MIKTWFLIVGLCNICDLAKGQSNIIKFILFIAGHSCKSVPGYWSNDSMRGPGTGQGYSYRMKVFFTVNSLSNTVIFKIEKMGPFMNGTIILLTTTMCTYSNILRRFLQDPRFNINQYFRFKLSFWRVEQLVENGALLNVSPKFIRMNWTTILSLACSSTVKIAFPFFLTPSPWRPSVFLIYYA
jgi:hypothetical protein